MNNFIYVIGAICLCAGCIMNEFKKSGLNVFLEFTGLVAMTLAYLIKW
jgi:hypothetical protein